MGAGNVAQRHARVLAGFGDVELVGVTDVVAESAQSLADQHQVRVFDDMETLIDAELDAVYVCVPPFAHGAAEEAVLDAGLPMFVEKPVAVDLDTALRINALVSKQDVLTAVGHHWRYLEVVDRARQLLAGRAVRLVNGSWLDRVPPVEWWTRRHRSGGPVVEQAAHVLDLIRLLAGEVSQVAAFGDGSPPLVDGADIDGVTVAALRFADGAVGTLTSACVLDWKHCAAVEIVAEGLVLQVGEDELMVREDGREYRFRGDPAAARVAVDRAFIDAVRGLGNNIRVPYAQAVRTHRLACAVAESVLTGETVRLPEVPSSEQPPPGRIDPAWAMAGWDG
ncbi:MAG TPA: Gfo/Idh/MocA family oxidoreductase [Micromonospora sp.]|nr:Gfo/Idh/MocA family oxidoreductase [Micromonospora sp.]